MLGVEAIPAILDMQNQLSQQGSWIVFVSLLVLVASHAFGQGAVIWVFISEIFPTRVRPRGQAFGCSTHWILAAVISQTFLLIAELAASLGRVGMSSGWSAATVGSSQQRVVDINMAFEHRWEILRPANASLRWG